MRNIESRDSLYLIWKDPKTRRNFVIGTLTRNGGYQFQYGGEYEQAKEAGWEEIKAFPENKVYESELLFPAFSSRLPDPKRRDIDKILKKYDLSAYDAYELLKRNGGKLPIDTYEFAVPISDDEKQMQRDFYVMGIRHVAPCNGNDCSCLEETAVGDELRLAPEPNNEKDPAAILILTTSNEKVGYVPRYYSKKILERLSRGEEYTCKVLEANKACACDDCIKVRLDMKAGGLDEAQQAVK